MEISWSVEFELANRFGGHIQSGEGKEKETQSMPDKEESGKESAKESDVTATTKAALASHWLTSNGHSYWSTLVLVTVTQSLQPIIATGKG